MSERIVVLDSSAMLALVRNESGGEVVRALLEDDSNVCYAHAVNLCEVFYDFGPPERGDNRERAELFMTKLATAGVIERNDMDGPFWRDMAALIAERRAQPPRAEKPRETPRLALGDAFGVALSRRLNAEFVTADRGEIEPIQSGGICAVQFIR